MAKNHEKYSANAKKIYSKIEFNNPTEKSCCLWYAVFVLTLPSFLFIFSKLCLRETKYQLGNFFNISLSINYFRMIVYCTIFSREDNVPLIYFCKCFKHEQKCNPAYGEFRPKNSCLLSLKPSKKKIPPK